jgi:hypothetical protein
LSCPFVLVVLVVLLGLLDFVDAAFRPIIADQVRGESIEGNNFAGISLENCRARHSADHAGILALRDSHSARRLYSAQSLRAIIAHAGHQNSHGNKPKLLRHGMK